jgi:AcrR family transcriptional regulator
MVRSRNPEQTRRAILDAASREFAAHGFAGGRTDAIAASAGVNKRMLYHYFGSKASLYAATLDDRVGAHATDASTETLTALVERRAIEAVRVPDDLRLLMWDALTDASPNAAALTKRAAAWRERVAALAAAQRDGRVAADLDAAQLELALTALTAFPVAFRRLATLITGAAPGDPAFDTAQREFLGAVMRRLTPQLAAVARPQSDAAAGPQSVGELSSDEPRRRKPRVRLTAATISRID